MDRQNNQSRTDLDLLNRSKPLSFLSPVALRELASCLKSANFRKHEVILSEAELAAGIHILLRGVAKITCLNHCDERVTIALLAPGPIPAFLTLPVSRWHFRCEAHSDCKVGSIGRDQFEVITKAAPRSALKGFHDNDLMQWSRFFEGSLSLLLGLDVRARLLSTLLRLCSSFGVIESRGTLLRISLSHKDLADLVGASRPRVTEHLAELEREHLLIRQGRQLIVCLDKIQNSTRIAPRGASISFAETAAESNVLKEARICSTRSLAPMASMKPMMRPSANRVFRPVNSARAMA